MKITLNQSTFSLLSLVLVLGLALTGCGTTSTTPTFETSSTSEAEATATEALIATEAPNAETGDCLVGSWNLTDFSSYMESIKSNISQESNGDITFTSGDFSGSATFVFNPDHTSSLITDNFTQSFTMIMSLSDQPIEIPITLIINGKSTAEYTIEGKNITFSNQNENDILIAVDVAGSMTTMTQSLFGDPGTQKLYQYDCIDSNTLSLKVIAVDNMDLAPLMLNKVQ
ncbi:MAG: hypothetical protein ACYDH1_19830 [Anaerolineaceae bacterium]